MKSDTKPAKSRPAKAQRAPAASVQIMPKPGHKASQAERRLFCALVATEMNPKQAYAMIRPATSPSGADGYGYAWAKEMAAEIAALKEQAAQAAGQAHGVTVAWLVGNMKEMFETPLAQINAESRFCKKYKVTETMTDAGPKTTIEVEKPCPLATLQAIAKQTGLEAAPAKPAEEAGQGVPTVRDLMAALIKPGSPIARRLGAGQADTKTA